jgi:hypothetical protein
VCIDGDPSTIGSTNQSATRLSVTTERTVSLTPEQHPQAGAPNNTQQVCERSASSLCGTCLGMTRVMLLLFALLLVLVLFGAGFALHVLWIVAVLLAAFWVVGFAIGRGEGAGRHRFYRW